MHLARLLHFKYTMKHHAKPIQGHRARKSLGQNFLIDVDIIARIVQAIAPQVDETIVEIGPGLGALTAPLLSHCGHMHVIELDRDLIVRLKNKFATALTIHSGDVLDFDFAQLVGINHVDPRNDATMQYKHLRIVGNLPYNISTPLLFHLFNVADQVQDQHFMLQKEVVQRMVAQPGSKAYGRLSVMLQWRYYMECLIDVPPYAFEPQPKVESAVVRMIPWPAAHMEAWRCNHHTFSEIVALAFSQRRKMLRNTLASLQQKIDFAALDFDLTRRAEDVPVDEYVRLARAYTAPDNEN